MIEATLQSDPVLMIGVVVGLAGTTLLIVRDTVTRARVERPGIVVLEEPSDLRTAA